MYLEVSTDVFFVFAVLERYTHIPKVPEDQGVFERVQTIPIRHATRNKKTSLKQNAKTKPEALKGKRKRWLPTMHITIAIQEQHCKTSQVGLFSLKELS